MLKQTLLISTLMAAGLLSAPAYAEGTFTGFYAGAEAGAVRSDSKSTVTPVTGAAASRTNKKTSADLGLFGGYGYQFDNGVYLGGEVSVNRPTTQSKAVTLAGVSVRERAQYEIAGKGIAGFGVGEDTLVYVSAGITQSRSKFLLPNNVTRKSNSDGKVFGIGVAQAFGDNLMGRVEYEKTTYDRKTFTTTGAPTVSYKPGSSRLTVGVAYKF